MLTQAPALRFSTRCSESGWKISTWTQTLVHRTVLFISFQNSKTHHSFCILSTPHSTSPFLSSGELRTATVMDRETAAGYKLIAQATDGGGLFCRSDISLKVLDVNDNAPSFASSYYLASVYENAAPKALITRLQATDPDEGRLACCYMLDIHHIK